MILKIQNRDGSLVTTITTASFRSWKEWDVNEVTIEGNGKPYLGKIGFFYFDNGTIIGSGIITKQKYNRNNNVAELSLYPIIYDLSQDLLYDGTGRIVYRNEDVANVIDYIITNYRATVTTPIISLGTKELTGATLKYTFDNKTWLEAFRFVQDKILRGNNFVRVDPYGVVTVWHTPRSLLLEFKKDVETISYEENADEIINTIYFDNGDPNNHLTATYTDAASISTYGRRARYIKDQRFAHIEAIAEYSNAILEKLANPRITIDTLRTTVSDIQLYDKITVSGWEKDFSDDLFVTGIVTLPTGEKEIQVSTDIFRSSTYGDDSESDALNTGIDASKTYIDNVAAGLLPSYIQETYIDSVEVRSPVIKGNSGYFFDTFKVGPSGIIIDGTNKLIKSSGYVAGSAGWQINDTGNAEFNNATLRGNLLAGTVNINNNFTVDSSGNVRGNDFINKTIFFESLGSTPATSDGKMWCAPSSYGGGKVLWWYFWNDSSKQQVSTSRMQSSLSFDRTSSTSLTTTMWFQPRLIIFNGFFENTGNKIYGITNGQAWSVSSSQWFANSMYLDFASLTWIVSNLSISQWASNYNFHYSDGSCTSTVNGCVTWLPSSWSWSNNNFDVVEQVRTSFVNDAFATDSISKNTYAYVSSWTDTSVTVQVVVPSGWRLAWNFTIFG